MTRTTETRQDRRHRATAEQIRDTARLLLTDRGPNAVTVNAVAREMGMSGPAVYHYFTGRDDLIEAVIADFYRDLTHTLESVSHDLAGQSIDTRLLAACRALRAWALNHPDEFGWMFASPVTPPSNRPGSPRLDAGRELERVFLDIVTELWDAGSFPAPTSADLEPTLRDQARAYAESIGSALPAPAMHVFLSSWIRLYGLVCMEVMGQLDFAYPEPTAVFEQCLRELCTSYGLTYQPPTPA